MLVVSGWAVKSAVDAADDHSVLAEIIVYVLAAFVWLIVFMLAAVSLAVIGRVVAGRFDPGNIASRDGLTAAVPDERGRDGGE